MIELGVVRSAVDICKPLEFEAGFDIRFLDVGDVGDEDDDPRPGNCDVDGGGGE